MKAEYPPTFVLQLDSPASPPLISGPFAGGGGAHLFCAQIGSQSPGMPTEKERRGEIPVRGSHSPPTSVPTDSVVTFPENGEFQKLTATPTKTPKRYVEQGLAYSHCWIEQSQFPGLKYQLGPSKSWSRQASCISEGAG